MSSPIAELKNLEVPFTDGRQLGPINLHIHPGEFWGVVGPNGAGKSTLLHVLAGLRKPRSGTCIHVIKPTIGIIFQHQDFRPDLPFTVEDVVFFGRIGSLKLGKPWTEHDHQSVEKALRLTGLTGFRKRLYRELSGGERRQVQVARLVAQEADLFLLDEPAAGLDLPWQEKLIHLISGLYLRTKPAVVMVTHEIHHLSAECNHVMLLKDGKPIFTGSPFQAFQSHRLKALYGCPMKVEKTRGRYGAYALGPGGLK